MRTRPRKDKREIPPIYTGNYVSKVCVANASLILELSKRTGKFNRRCPDGGSMYVWMEQWYIFLIVVLLHLYNASSFPPGIQELCS